MIAVGALVFLNTEIFLAFISEHVSAENLKSLKLYRGDDFSADNVFLILIQKISKFDTHAHSWCIQVHLVHSESYTQAAMRVV